VSQVRILSSTCVPFSPTTVQMPNLTLIEMKQISVCRSINCFCRRLSRVPPHPIPQSPSAMHGQRVRLQCSLSLFLSLYRGDSLPVPAADGEEGKDQKKTTAKSSGIFQYIFFLDGRSKPDFVYFEILVRPISSSATSTEQPISELHGEVGSFKPV